MTFEEFTKLAGKYNVIPVSKTLLADTLTPVSAYLHLREESSSSFLLESVEGGERIARYSFIGRDPRVVIRCKDTITTVTEGMESSEKSENFFDILDGVSKSFSQPSLPHLPRFTGGLVGFIGYDSIRFVERIPNTTKDPLDLEDSILGLFTSVVAFDHLKHQVILIVNAILTDGQSMRSEYDRALEEIDRLERLLLAPQPKSRPFTACLDRLVHETESDDYRDAVLKAKRYIHDGDIFQVVLSQRFATEYNGDPFNAYRALRVINPSPYLYYLDFEGLRVIGSSPEILVRVEDGTAEVFPIAGTRPRGSNDAEDKLLEVELLSDEKERAEHVMLVDLGRNDLGRVCTPGSVKVDQLMNIVRYSHVMHIASRVIGKVSEGKSCIDVLKATFPAGTVSGAPKIRAMEIIDELERTRRGLYAGGVGYFDFSGNMNMCIAIRTMFATSKTLYFQAGAGIVADSNPDREYQETINKTQALVEALKMAQGISS